MVTLSEALIKVTANSLTFGMTVAGRFSKILVSVPFIVFHYSFRAGYVNIVLKKKPADIASPL